MNVFGFLATIIICGAIVAVAWFVFNKPIRIEYTKIEKRPTKDIVKDTTVVDLKKIEEDLNKQPVVSMDNVIRSANEMMGINISADEEKDKE